MCIQRERERWRGERCGALSLLEVCIYIYSERERGGEESGVVRCQCLEKRERARGTCTKPAGRQPPQTPGSPSPIHTPAC